MDIQNNNNYKYEKNNKIRDLSNEEINELRKFFNKNNCYCCYFFSIHFREIYDLFINNKIFEPNINNANYVDDLYYLGVYYENIKNEYDLAKKYYLMAIGKGSVNAIDNLGYHYQYVEKNYDLMKKYYLQAVDKGNSDSMNNLGIYYERTEENYDLMKKYYLQAIEKGNTDAVYNLGDYYQYKEINYDLMKKYYLMAIDMCDSHAMYALGSYYQYKEKNYDLAKKYYLKAIKMGNTDAMAELDFYFERNFPKNEDLQKYFNYSIRGNITIKNYDTFYGEIENVNVNVNENVNENRMIDLFCSEIDNNDLEIKNFKFCLLRIVNYINYRKLYKMCEPCELKNIKHFVKYINKLRYSSKNKQEYKKCTNETLTMYASQIFIEYLDLYYYKYLEKIFSPGGKGYIKTKKHFELIAEQQKNNN